jgi:hypothetical protein
MADPQRVEIMVGGEIVVGLLRLPDGPGPHPALVFLGPLTSVKEQVPGNYADALTRRGFATLAIDNRHFGESGGQPRNFEHPGRKVADVRAALGWLADHPMIDGARLGAVGVCAGAGYMAGAVAADPRIRAFAAVAGFFHDATRQREWMGDGYDAAIDRARAARERYEATGESAEIPAVGDGDVAMPMAEAFEYYGTERGAVANYTNAFAVMSREHTLPWDAQGFAPAIAVPTLMIHAENALAPALARSFFAALGGTRTEMWVESKGQIDFYDDPAMIEPAADRLAVHFRESLSS